MSHYSDNGIFRDKQVERSFYEADRDEDKTWALNTFINHLCSKIGAFDHPFRARFKQTCFGPGEYHTHIRIKGIKHSFNVSDGNPMFNQIGAFVVTQWINHGDMSDAKPLIGLADYLNECHYQLRGYPQVRFS